LSNKVKLCVLVDEGLRIESVEVYGQMGEVAMVVHDFVSDEDAANILVVGQNTHNTGCVETCMMKLVVSAKSRGQ
jgi:hypothetical protein